MENEKNIWEVGTPFEDHHQIPRHVEKVILDNADANSVFQIPLDQINDWFFNNWDDLDESNPVWYAS
tara:strand:+ start:413 stop:613 length:201 start_codon:yes stop_codon:yes gene_type:complete